MSGRCQKSVTPPAVAPAGTSITLDTGLVHYSNLTLLASFHHTPRSIRRALQLVEDGVKVTADLTGLTPGRHGFHIHEKGDCSSGDGMSTGGHFNPTAQAHGAHGVGSHHTGDLPSLKADANGVAKLAFESTTISVESGATNIIGKGLIVHRDPDDYKTQPTGNAGPRLACAVIQKI